MNTNDKPRNTFCNRTRREFLWLLAASLLNITLWMLLSAYAVRLMDSGRAAIVAYTMPLWSILLGAIFLRETITAERLIGVFLGLTGMALLLGEDLLGLHATPLGTLLMAGAALSWAAGTVVVKYATPALSTIALGGWQMLIGALPLATGALLLEQVDPASISLRPALGLLYNMLIGSSLCVWIWFRIVALYAAGVAAMSTLLIPVIGVMSGAALLGEPVGWPEVIALVLVITSLAIVHGIWRRQPPGP